MHLAPLKIKYLLSNFIVLMMTPQLKFYFLVPPLTPIMRSTKSIEDLDFQESMSCNNLPLLHCKNIVSKASRSYNNMKLLNNLYFTPILLE
jgi:hypothetical protein